MPASVLHLSMLGKSDTGFLLVFEMGDYTAEGGSCKSCRWSDSRAGHAGMSAFYYGDTACVSLFILHGRSFLSLARRSYF